VIVISILFSIVVAVVVFGVLILIHEFGHFITAKLSGVKVNEFALGMGPVLLKHKKGETQYSLRLFPIGGFISMEGEDKESTDERSFNNIAVWKRIIIVCAGAFMNIMLGFIIVCIIMAASQSLSSTTISKFADNSVSNKSGLQVGDKILEINGQKVNIYSDIVFNLVTKRNGTADVTVNRNNTILDLKSVNFPLVSDGNGGKAMTIDFGLKSQSKNVISVVQQSFYWTIATVKLVWVTLIQLFGGSYTIKDLSGPVGVASAMGTAASHGFMDLLIIVALITINLGVVNLLPLPALDGGRLVFLIIEAIRRKPVKPEVEGYIHFAGFVCLMLLVVVVTFNDVARLNIIGFLQGVKK
jgi:regulator of sigma E protease